MNPYPGKQGKAEYCGPGAHFYEDFGHAKPTCKDCGWVKGQRGKRR